MKNEMLSKIVRILTVPPILALLMFTYLLLCVPGVFPDILNYIMAVSFICIFPSLAYVLQIPLRKWFPGRDGQRTLAMILSVVGYVCGLTTSLLLHQTPQLVFIYLTYFICGLSILISSKIFHFKLSGHAVGSAGPIAILMIFRQWIFLIGIPILICVFLSSSRLKRHTTAQIISGMILPFCIGWALSPVFLY